MRNNPPAPGSSGSGGRTGGLPPELAGLGATLGEGGLQNVLGNMDQQQLMQLLNSGGLGGMGGMGGLGSLGGLIGAGRPSSSHQTASSTGQSRGQSSPAVHSHETTSSTSQPSQTATVATTQPRASTTSTTTVPTPTTAAAAATANQAIQLGDLQTILNTMNIPHPDGAEGADGVPQQPPIDLNKVLTSEAMAPILAKPEVQEKLIPFLP